MMSGDANRQSSWAKHVQALADLVDDLARTELAAELSIFEKASLNAAIGELRAAGRNVTIGNAANEAPRHLKELARVFRALYDKMGPPLKPFTEEPRVVWVLGSGFSKPLGGPLLTELFTPGSFKSLERRVPDNPTATLACEIYNYGRGYFRGSLFRTAQNPRGEVLWDDAEQYIDLLDSASETARLIVDRATYAISNSHGTTLRKTDIDRIYHAARQILAAECGAFAWDASVDQERWSAHVGWAKLLNGRHTIVTFNYDTALEKIASHIEKEPGFVGGPAVMLPGRSPAEPGFKGRALTLKLHGSVNWKDEEGKVLRAENDDFAMQASPKQLVLCTPGPSKQDDATRLLGDLWQQAELMLKGADAIVFVGYRFPPSDAVARRFLLSAIEARAKSDQLRPLAMHVVLGPNSQDAARLAELLRYAAERGGMREDAGRSWVRKEHFRVRVHEMYSQDFFTVYRETMLLS
jgi:hypothetical protein